MPHHIFYLIALPGTGLYYRTGHQNKSKGTKQNRRRSRTPRASLVEPASATHYPNEDYAEAAINGIIEAKGHSYEELQHYLGRPPQKDDLTIEPFRALRL